MEENKIVYKPHCGNCGCLIDTSEYRVAFRDIYNRTTETMLAEKVSTEIYPDRCDNCGAPFNTIEIPMPEKLNDVLLGGIYEPKL